MHPWQKMAEAGFIDAEYAAIPRNDVRVVFAHEPKRVMDVGCARGHVGAALKIDYNAYVWGIELNSLAAQIAGKQLDKVSTYPIEQFTEQDIKLLKTMDTILLLDVLEHMYNPWQALAFLSEHVAESAQIIMSIPNVGHGGIMRDLAAGHWQYKNQGLLDVTHIRFFTTFEIEKMLSETGFRPEIWSFNMGGLNVPAPVNVDEPSAYPFWLDLGDVQVKIKNHIHWMAINAVQCVIRARVDKNVQPVHAPQTYSP